MFIVPINLENVIVVIQICVKSITKLSLKVRSQLDVIKRKELERLRHLAMRQFELQVRPQFGPVFDQLNHNQEVLGSMIFSHKVSP